MKKYVAFLITVGFVLSSTALAEIEVQNPWARATTGTNTAVYMKLINTSNQDVMLVSASSGVANQNELHAIVDNGSGLEMQKITGIRIPASGNINLEPGKTHVMLMKLNRALSEGENIPLTLTFDDGAQLEIYAPVRAQ